MDTRSLSYHRVLETWCIRFGKKMVSWGQEYKLCPTCQRDHIWQVITQGLWAPPAHSPNLVTLHHHLSFEHFGHISAMVPAVSSSVLLNNASVPYNILGAIIHLRVSWDIIISHIPTLRSPSVTLGTVLSTITPCHVGRPWRWLAAAGSPVALGRAVPERGILKPTLPRRVIWK